MDLSSTSTGAAASSTQGSSGSSKWIRPYFVPPAPQGSNLVLTDDPKKLYWDRSHYNSKGAQIRALHHSSTLYVGNLAFTTRTQHVWQHFAYLGPVKRVVMGLDRLKKTPCGFCFVEYDQRSHALAAVAHLSGTKLDGNLIRVELDAGFADGRQYGRGASGGQVRHDRKEQRKRSRYESEDGTMDGGRGGGGNSSNSNTNSGGDNQEGGSGIKPEDGGYYGPDGRQGGEQDEDTMEPSAKRQRL